MQRTRSEDNQGKNRALTLASLRNSSATAPSPLHSRSTSLSPPLPLLPPPLLLLGLRFFFGEPGGAAEEGREEKGGREE